MRRLKLFEPLRIDIHEETKFHLPVHNHTYYEIIFIYFGDGIHHLNGIQMNYEAGDLFLLAPEDEHYFDIHHNTRFIFIKFTDAYFRQQKYLSSEEYFMLEPTSIMRHHAIKEDKLAFGDACKTILKNTIDNILIYSCREEINTSAILFHQILSLFALVKEAVIKKDGFFVLNAENKELILGYVHEHIYQPALLQIQEIAAEFSIAPNYFSAYFKRTFEISYRDYINNYRSKLIERRVAFGNFTLKQIAAEFGFTDESHFSRFFRKQFQVTPKVYRNQLLKNEEASV